MRILHINCNYIYSTLHQKMVEGLSKEGYENQVYVPVCRSYNKSTVRIQPNSNVYVDECFYSGDRWIYGLKQMKIIHGVKKHYDIQSYKIIHAYTLFTDGNCAMRLYQEYGIPYVVAVRNTDINSFFPLRPHLRGRGIKIMRNAKAVFFMSEASRDIVFEKYVPKKYHDELLKKTHIIPNGIDDFWFEHAPDKEQLSAKKCEDNIKLIYVGMIDKNKNITTTQKAMDILHSKGYNVSLTVVGPVYDNKEFDLIKKNDYTTYIPSQNKEQLINYYRSHDIFVMPSFKETFGLVYAEAMSQGLPVIYTKNQGFDRQFEEGVVGYHVDSSSPVEIADRIIDIVDKYSAFPNECVEKSRRFMWDGIVSEYINIYKS